MHRFPWKVAACVALVVTAATGCSGGDTAASPPPSSEPTTIGGQPTTTVRPVDTSFTGQGSSGFCGLARTFTERFARIGAPSTPAQLRTSFGEARMAINQAADAAPAEIKADMQILNTTVADFFTKLERANFDITGLDPRSLSNLQAPEFLTASQRLDAYLRNVCRTG